MSKGAYQAACWTSKGGEGFTSWGEHNWRRNSAFGGSPGDPRPAVLERHGAVEHEAGQGRVRVDAEIAEPLELVAGAGRDAGDAPLEFAAGEHFERRRIEGGAAGGG